MLPKRVYLNYVNEDDDDKTWSEKPVTVSDCDMINRVYTDLLQVWNHPAVVPEENNRNIIYITRFQEIYVERIPRCLCGELTPKAWNSFAKINEIVIWAYVNDLLPYTKHQWTVESLQNIC